MYLTKTIVDKAIELISQPNGWTTNAYARDMEGELVLNNNNEACQFCLIGALSYARYFAGDSLLYTSIQSEVGRISEETPALSAFLRGGNKPLDETEKVRWYITEWNDRQKNVKPVIEFLKLLREVVPDA